MFQYEGRMKQLCSMHKFIINMFIVTVFNCTLYICSFVWPLLVLL